MRVVRATVKLVPLSVVLAVDVSADDDDDGDDAAATMGVSNRSMPVRSDACIAVSFTVP